MAAPADSKALVKRKAEQSLMPPPPPPKRIKRPAIVLDEDVYAETLSRIIKRDFFPGLVEVEAQLEFLDAMESKDTEWIQESSLRLNQIMTPGPTSRKLRNQNAGTPSLFATVGETPRSWVGGTPRSEAGSTNTNTTERKATMDENMRLSTFQAKYVSEDSESFYKLVDKHNAKRREKNAWVYNGNKLPSKQQVAIKARAERLLEASKDPKKAMELAIRNPEDTRRAMPDIRRLEPLNTFMFGPESIDEPTTGPPLDEIVYENGHLTEPPPSVAPSPALSAIDAAIQGRPRPAPSEAGLPSSDARTPAYAGYKLVNATPTAAELAAAAQHAQHAAPRPEDLLRLLPAPDPSPAKFSITPRPKRDELARKMVDDIARRNAASTSAAASAKATAAAAAAAPTPRFRTAPTPARTPRLMTPAARSLLERIRTPRAAAGAGGGAKGFDSFALGTEKTAARRALATPTPRLKRPG